MWTKKHRQQRSNSQKIIWANRSSEEKFAIFNKVSKAKKGRCLSEKHKKKISKALLGHKFNLGRKLTQEHKHKISVALKGWKGPVYNEEHKKRISLFMKELWKKPDYAKYIKESRRAGFESKEYREEREKIAKELWQNSEYVQKQMRARGVKPNKAEIKLSKLLKKILPREYKYVGDGQFILGGKCPDFMNINGKKLLIELYGDYWHRNDNPKERIDYFKKYGFNTLIVWEKELINESVLNQRIIEFTRKVVVI